MAGDWIKMRTDLGDDPGVIALAARLGLGEDTVIGKLYRIWNWADRHTATGVVPGIGGAWIDRLVELPGFAAAMAAVGWLVIETAGIQFPHFDRHNGTSAKRRAIESERKRSVRNLSAFDADKMRTKCGQNADQRREEKRREEDSLFLDKGGLGGNGGNGGDSQEPPLASVPPTPEALAEARAVAAAAKAALRNSNPEP